MNSKGFLAAAVLAASALFGGTAIASPVIQTVVLPGNDCAGTFGRPFASCEIPDQYGASPIIAKFTIADSGAPLITQIEVNTALFPSVTGAEFGITFNADASAGTWTYTPGLGDPLVTAWVAKGGPNFRLFYTDPKTGVTSGEWSTPAGQRLSHISFYDTAAPPNGVPTPAALALFGVALIGLAGVSAFRRS